MKNSLFSILFAALLITMAAGCDTSPAVRHINNNQTEICFEARTKFLLLPVEDGIPNAAITVCGANIPTQTLRVAMARTRVDYYVPFDLTPYHDTEVTFEVDNCAYDALCWERLELSDTFRPDEESQYRPVYHHTPAYGWMNDPNGMVWYDGEYHLFYQHNPYGSRWENLSWGHSVSRDLLHWEHLSGGLKPDSLGMIFSGCCVIDKEDTAGFGKDAMVALYTAAGDRQTQCLAYSTDRGRTFTKYAGNPVLTGDVPDFRDPKVFWCENTERWIMVLAVGHNMEFYSSPDLKRWTFESRFGVGQGSHAGVWECPDLFELPIDGDPQRKCWVLICSLNTETGSKVQYFTGNFDGHVFTNDTAADVVKWMDFGRDHYATVTWANVPDGRRIAMGWMNNWQYANEVPTTVFRSINTLPRTLSLRTDHGQRLLRTVPCGELLSLRAEQAEIAPFTVDAEYNIPPLSVHKNGAYCIEMVIDNESAEIFGCKLFNCNGEYIDLCINCVDETVWLDRAKSGRCDFSPAFPVTYPAPFFFEEMANCKITLYIDRSSVEGFLNDGQMVISNLIFPSQPYDRMNFYSKGGRCHIKSLKFYSINQ